MFRKEYNLKVISISLGVLFLFSHLLHASPLSFQRETLRIPMTDSKRVTSTLPSNRTVVKSLVYPTEGKKTEITTKVIDVDKITAHLKTHSNIINQFTLTLIPAVTLTEEAKTEIVKTAKEENVSLTIVQLEMGEKGKLTDTLFSFAIAEIGKRGKILEEFEVMLPPNTESIKGHIIYSDIIDVTEIDESEQDRLSAKAMFSQGDLKFLNYNEIGNLAFYYSDTIDFLVEVINELGATRNPNVLDTLLYLQAITSECLDKCSPIATEKQLEEVFSQNLEKLKTSLNSSVEVVKNQEFSFKTFLSLTKGESPLSENEAAQYFRERRKNNEIVLILNNVDMRFEVKPANELHKSAITDSDVLADNTHNVYKLRGGRGNR